MLISPALLYASKFVQCDDHRLCNSIQSMLTVTRFQLEMWANAQRDGRPAEHRWRPVQRRKFG